MKRFFSTLLKNPPKSDNSQFLKNMEKMQERFRKAEEEMNKLPLEARPKPVKSEEIEKTLKEAEMRQKTQSIY